MHYKCAVMERATPSATDTTVIFKDGVAELRELVLNLMCHAWTRAYGYETPTSCFRHVSDVQNVHKISRRHDEEHL